MVDSFSYKHIKNNHRVKKLPFSLLSKASSSFEKNDTVSDKKETERNIDIGPDGDPVFTSEESSRHFNRALIALGSTLSLSYEEATTFLLSHPKLYETTMANGQILPPQAPLQTKLLYFQSDIGISKKKLKQMILSKPSLMANALYEIEEFKTSIELLQFELNMTGQEIWNLATKRFPQVKSYHRTDLRKRLNFYLHEMNFTKDELKGLILRHPKILQISPLVLQEAIEKMQSTFRYTTISLDDIQVMLSKYPGFLTYDIEKKFLPTIQYLLEGEVGESLGMITKEKRSTLTTDSSKEKRSIIEERVKRLLVSLPDVVSLSLEQNLIPTVQFFLSNEDDGGVGCTMEQFGKILWRFPDVLHLSLQNNLLPKIQYLRERLDFENGVPGSDETLSHMIVRNPTFLRASLVTNLKPKIKFFQNYLGLEIDELRSFLVTRPQILGLSLHTNIMPKIEYYLSKEGGDLTKEELKQFLLNKPGQLSFPLKGRIVERVEKLKANGIHLRDAPVTIVTRSESSFNQWLKEYLSKQDNSG